VDFLVVWRPLSAAFELTIAQMQRIFRYAFRASVRLVSMWILARLTHFSNGYREPRKAMVLPHAKFVRLFATQQWWKCNCWHDGRDQYALCEKA
jgi:hypothetical protein